MTKYCKACSKATLVEYEKVEMEEAGSFKRGKAEIHIYQCPICDTIKAETHFKDGRKTTRTMTVDEVDAMADELPKKSGAGGMLLALGLAAAGLLVIAGVSSGE